MIKKVELVPTWRKIFFTYSFWLTTASVVLTIINIVLPYMGFLQPFLSTAVYGWSMFGLNVCAGIAKFIKQRKLWDTSQEVIQDDEVPK
jgi:hypothetical protein